jgi:hypothetical protein
MAREALRVSRGLPSKPLSLERSERRGAFFDIPVNSLVVDSTFDQSKNVANAHFLLAAAICCVRCGLHNNRFMIVTSNIHVLV